MEINELNTFDFSEIVAKTAPNPTALPGAKKELPPFPFVMSYPDPATLPILEAHEAMGEILKKVGNTPTLRCETTSWNVLPKNALWTSVLMMFF